MRDDDEPKPANSWCRPVSRVNQMAYEGCRLHREHVVGLVTRQVSIISHSDPRNRRGANTPRNHRSEQS
jgi:hypothetical protein